VNFWGGRISNYSGLENFISTNTEDFFEKNDHNSPDFEKNKLKFFLILYKFPTGSQNIKDSFLNLLSY
jgi:hypothetical protein